MPHKNSMLSPTCKIFHALPGLSDQINILHAFRFLVQFLSKS